MSAPLSRRLFEVSEVSYCARISHFSLATLSVFEDSAARAHEHKTNSICTPHLSRRRNPAERSAFQFAPLEPPEKNAARDKPHPIRTNLWAPLLPAEVWTRMRNRVTRKRAHSYAKARASCLMCARALDLCCRRRRAFGFFAAIFRARG